MCFDTTTTNWALSFNPFFCMPRKQSSPWPVILLVQPHTHHITHTPPPHHMWHATRAITLFFSAAALRPLLLQHTTPSGALQQDPNGAPNVMEGMAMLVFCVAGGLLGGFGLQRGRGRTG